MKDKLSKSGGKINISGKTYGKISVVLIQGEKFILKNYKDKNGDDNLRCLTSGGGEKGNSDIHLSHNYDINTTFSHLLKMGTDSKLVLDDDKSILSRPRWSKFYIEKKSSDGYWMRTYFIGLNGKDINLGDKFVHVDNTNRSINQDTRERILYNNDPNNGWKGRNIHNMIEYASDFPITIENVKDGYKSKDIKNINRYRVDYRTNLKETDNIGVDRYEIAEKIDEIKNNNITFKGVNAFKDLLEQGENKKELLNIAERGLIMNAIYYPKNIGHQYPNTQNGYIDDKYIKKLEEFGLEIKRSVFVKKNKDIDNIKTPTGLVPLENGRIDLKNLDKFDLENGELLLLRHQNIIVPFYLDVSKEYVDGIKRTEKGNDTTGVLFGEESTTFGSTKIGLWIFNEEPTISNNIYPKNSQIDKIEKELELAQQQLKEHIVISGTLLEQDAITLAAATQASLVSHIDKLKKSLSALKGEDPDLVPDLVPDPGPVLGTLPPPPTPVIGGGLKVMSFNVLAKNFTNKNVKYDQDDKKNNENDSITTERYNKSIDLINDSDPDVVCIQECDKEYKNRLLKIYNHVISKNVGDGSHNNNVGVAIFCKKDLEVSNIFNIKGHSSYHIVGATIKKGSIEYNVYSLHLPTSYTNNINIPYDPKNPKNPKNKNEEEEYVKEQLMKHNTMLNLINYKFENNFIIVGDFNRELSKKFVYQNNYINNIDIINSKYSITVSGLPDINEIYKYYSNNFDNKSILDIIENNNSDINHQKFDETSIIIKNNNEEKKNTDHMIYSKSLKVNKCEEVGELIYPYDRTQEKDKQALKTGSNGSDHRPIMCKFEI